MDDPQAKQHTDAVGPAPVATTSPAASSQSQPQQPVAPVGNVNKEAAPIPQVVEATPSDHTEIAPKLDQELKEAGVEHSPQVEHPQLSLEDKRAGIEAAKASVPISQTSGSQVQFPLTEQKIEEIQKTTSIKDSLRWFAEEVLREIKKAHEKLTKKDTE